MAGWNQELHDIVIFGHGFVGCEDSLLNANTRVLSQQLEHQLVDERSPGLPTLVSIKTAHALVQ